MNPAKVIVGAPSEPHFFKARALRRRLAAANKHADLLSSNLQILNKHTQKVITNRNLVLAQKIELEMRIEEVLKVTSSKKVRAILEREL
jgi:hypothetical protein